MRSHWARSSTPSFCGGENGLPLEVYWVTLHVDTQGPKKWWQGLLTERLYMTSWEWEQVSDVKAEHVAPDPYFLTGYINSTLNPSFGTKHCHCMHRMYWSRYTPPWCLKLIYCSLKRTSSSTTVVLYIPCTKPPVSTLHSHMSTISLSRWADFNGPVKVSHSVHADTGSSSLGFDCWFEDRLLNPSFTVETQTAESAACRTRWDISAHKVQPQTEKMS